MIALFQTLLYVQYVICICNIRGISNVLVLTQMQKLYRGRQREISGLINKTLVTLTGRVEHIKQTYLHTSIANQRVCKRIRALILYSWIQFENQTDDSGAQCM